MFHPSLGFENALIIFWAMPLVLGIYAVVGGAKDHVGLTIDTMLTTASMSSLNRLAILAHGRPASFAVLLDSGPDLMHDLQVEILISTIPLIVVVAWHAQHFSPFVPEEKVGHRRVKPQGKRPLSLLIHLHC